ncbi:hypothetical protein BKA62DRAFT_698490 [Auriculariales sp. MPI-PUGE-AT-0066]|nr:hypothetical protein BKA62DRAFT_698490 [Auriculariales sp. MPI-PUGE-AT-0066]
MSSSQYLSGRSAEVILSDVRPTKARPETLYAVNKLLDELLLLALSSARSIATEKLKAGLLKVLPTPLGKDAILEAEIELRAYQERTAPADPTGAVDNSSPKDFPLVPVFELLRMKCEAYSTLSDFDGDAEVEAQLQQRIATAGGPAAPRVQAIAPAALYLTAILEHVLSNVARVVARNSSQSTAHVQDLYVALCEDETIYNLFKSMKVYEEIEQQSQQHQQPRTRRSRSFSHDATSPASPIHNGSSTFSVDRSTTTAVEASDEGFSVGHGHRTSMNKVFKASHMSNSGDRSSSPASTKHHNRSESIVSAMRRSADVHTPSADSAEDQEFDNLLKSGNVMKLSLTPDRLQTFEVAKEKAQRKGAVVRSPSSPSQPPPSGHAHTGSKALQKARPVGNGHRGISSISSQSPVSAEDNTMSLANGVSRSLSKSTHPNGVSFAQPNIAKPHPVEPSSKGSSPGPAVSRKASLTAGLAAPSAFKAPSPQRSPVPTTDNFDMSSGFPKKNRHVKRDSLEFDEEDDDLPPTPRRKPAVAGGAMTAKANGPNDGMSARDLMDFLSEGPPEPVPLPDPAPVKPKPGSRLRSMVSRLTKGSSDNLKLDAQPSAKPITMPPAVRPSASASLNAIKNRPAYAPPPPASQFARPSSPHSSSSNELDAPDAQSSHHRKPVPAWDSARPTPSTPTSASQPTPSTPSRQQTHREATIIKGLPSPAEPESHESVARPIKPPPKPPRAAGNSGVAPTPASASGPPPAPTINLPLVQASDLRERMLTATSPLECRLLVDIFLARCGFELPTNLPALTVAEPTVEEMRTAEFSMVDTLLGEGPAVSFAAGFEEQRQPAAVEATA